MPGKENRYEDKALRQTYNIGGARELTVRGYIAGVQRRLLVMVKLDARCGALVWLLCANACSDVPPTRPTSPMSLETPTPAPPRSVLPTGQFVPSFPAALRPARVYVAERFSGPSPYHGSELASRFVFYEDDTFALQYSSVNHPFFEYLGTYKGAGESIELAFQANAGQWKATAIVTDAALSVTFNQMMVLDDFEDGSYRRVGR
jgi:hypothetical protein